MTDIDPEEHAADLDRAGSGKLFTETAHWPGIATNLLFTADRLLRAGIRGTFDADSAQRWRDELEAFEHPKR